MEDIYLDEAIKLLEKRIYSHDGIIELQTESKEILVIEGNKSGLQQLAISILKTAQSKAENNLDDFHVLVDNPEVGEVLIRYKGYAPTPATLNYRLLKWVGVLMLLFLGYIFLFGLITFFENANHSIGNFFH